MSADDITKNSRLPGRRRGGASDRVSGRVSGLDDVDAQGTEVELLEEVSGSTLLEEPSLLALPEDSSLSALPPITQETLLPDGGEQRTDPAVGGPGLGASSGGGGLPTPVPDGDGPTNRWRAPPEPTRLITPETGSGSSIGIHGGPRRGPGGFALRMQERLGLLGGDRRRGGRQGTAGRPVHSLRGTLLLVLFVSVLGGLGIAAGRLLRQRRVDRLQRAAEEAFEAAHRRGNLADLLAAARRYQELLVRAPANGPALGAQAQLLGEAVFEFGEPGEEAGGAARLVQTETTQAAQAAQVYQALLAADVGAAAERVAVLVKSRTSSSATSGPGGGDLGFADYHAYLAGLVALHKGNDAEAVEALQRAVLSGGSPGQPLWHHHLAMALLQTGREAEAQAELEAALRLNPEHQLSLIDAAWLRGRRRPEAQEEARRTLQQVVDRQAGGPQARGQIQGPSRTELCRANLSLADLALSASPPALSPARAYLSRGQELCPQDDLLLLERLAAGLLQARKSAAAEQAARQVLARASFRKPARLTLAGALIQRGQPEEALSVLAPLLDQEGGHEGAEREKDAFRGRALLLQAQALLLADQTPRAQEVARQAEALGTRQGGGGTLAETAITVEAELLLARSFVGQEERLLAQQMLHRLLPAKAQAQPGPALTREQALRAQLIQAQLLLGFHPGPTELKEAQALLQSIVARDPTLSEARLSLGRLLKQLGRLGEAKEQLVKALEIEEAQPVLRRELGNIAMAHGEPELARAQFDQLLSSEGDADLLIRAARAHRLSGDPKGALELLAQVHRSRGELREGPDEELLAEKGRALLAAGRPAEVVTLLREPARGARRPALPALLMRAYLSGSGPDSGGSDRARDLLLGLPEAWRRDEDVQLAEVELLSAEGKTRAAQIGAEALSARLRERRSTGEEAQLLAALRRILEK